ncbi:MAG: hypothetical protein HYV16_08580 [Gammaproteobacteria bacterium]|nr:hypothetical protein [Gammaproteobacteria bacterium]
MLSSAPTPLNKPAALVLPRKPELRLGTPPLLRSALPWLLAGLATAAVLGLLFDWGGAPVRAQAALLAVGAFSYLAAGLQAGSFSLSLAGGLSLAGFASLAWLGLDEGPVLLALGFWLQAAWSISLGWALRWLKAPGLPAAWIGLQLGMAVVSVL